jgi:hypothetical protein
MFCLIREKIIKAIELINWGEYFWPFLNFNVNSTMCSLWLKEIMNENFRYNVKNSSWYKQDFVLSRAQKISIKCAQKESSREFSSFYQMCFNSRTKFSKKIILISRSFKHFNTSVCWQSLWNWLLTLDIRYRSSSNIEILSRDDFEVSTLLEVSFRCQRVCCLPRCFNEWRHP